MAVDNSQPRPERDGLSSANLEVSNNSSPLPQTGADLLAILLLALVSTAVGLTIIVSTRRHSS